MPVRKSLLEHPEDCALSGLHRSPLERESMTRDGDSCISLVSACFCFFGCFKVSQTRLSAFNVKYDNCLSLIAPSNADGDAAE